MEKMENMFESLKSVKYDDLGNMLKSMIEYMKNQQLGSSNASEGEQYMVWA